MKMETEEKIRGMAKTIEEAERKINEAVAFLEGVVETSDDVVEKELNYYVNQFLGDEIIPSICEGEESLMGSLKVLKVNLLDAID